MTSPAARLRRPARQAAAAALALIALLAAPAAASASVTITSPLDGATVSGSVKYSAASATRPREIRFYVDGARLGTDRRSPWALPPAGYLATQGLNAGAHTLRAVALERNGTTTTARATIYTTQSLPDPTPAPAPTPTPAPAPTWSDSFSAGSLAGWSWVNRSDGGTMQAVDTAAQGIPPSASGDTKAALFEVTAAQKAAGKIHSKVYKNWAIAAPETTWYDDAGRRLDRLPGNSPAGTYAARYYIPADYHATGTWTNIFQWKEDYTDSAGAWHSDPTWWINICAASAWGGKAPAASRPDAPVLFANHWTNNWNYTPQMRIVPLGRWFEIRAELYPGDRIDWYLDGEKFDTSPNTRYPVGPAHGANTTGWIFGIGHYDGIGKLYTDTATYTPR